MEKILETLSKVKTDSSVIPESCLSFSEMSDYIELFVSNKYNSVMNAIENQEIDYIRENNKYIIYENDMLKNLTQNNSSIFIESWSVRKDFWTKVFNKFKNKSDNSKNIRIENTYWIQDDIKIGSIHEFSELLEESKEYYYRAVDLIEETRDKLYDASNKEEIENIYKELKQNSFYNISECTVSNCISKSRSLKSRLIGNMITVNKEYIRENTSELNNVASCNNINNYVKEAYNNEKRLTMYITKIVEDFTNIYPDYSNLATKCYSTILNEVYRCYSVEMDVLMRKVNETCVLISKAKKYNSK